MLLQAKSLFKRSVEASAARKASTNPRDIDISQIFPEWERSTVVQNPKKQNILGVFLKKSKDTYWEADFIFENEEALFALKKYTKHDSCLTIYNQIGQFVEKGRYSEKNRSYTRFLIAKSLFKQARISDDVPYTNNGVAVDIPGVTVSAKSEQGPDIDWSWLWYNSYNFPTNPITYDSGDGGNNSGGSGGGGGTPPPPCTDADGCGCEDLQCKLAKAVERKKKELNDAIDAFSNSILVNEPILDEANVLVKEADSWSNKSARTTVDNQSEVILPYTLEKNNGLELHFDARGKTQKINNTITWVPASFNNDSPDDLEFLGHHLVYTMNCKNFHVIQSTSEDDKKMCLRIVGALRIFGTSANFEVGIPGLSDGPKATFQFQPYTEKRFQRQLPWLEANKYYK